MILFCGTAEVCADVVIIMPININFLLLPTRFHIVAASASELKQNALVNCDCDERAPIVGANRICGPGLLL